MMVSPSSCQSVVVAVLSSVRGLYEVDELVSRFKNNFEPSALLSVIVEPMVKYPEDDSGPSIGFPPEDKLILDFGNHLKG